MTHYKEYNVPEVEHAKLSASGYYRWHKDACPGSVQMCKGLTSKTSRAAAEGTVAHELAERGLKLKEPLAKYVGQTFHVEGYSFKVTDEMLTAVETYVNVVLDDKEPEDSLFVEVYLTSHLRELDEAFGGLADAVLLKPRERKLKVYDYKHGRGIYVETVNNKQLQYYALGAFLAHGKRSPIDEVEVTVVQPRYHGKEPVRSWSFDVLDLLRVEHELVESAELTRRPNAPVKAGSWCRFCPAAKESKCETYMETKAKEREIDDDLFEDLT